MSVNSWAYPKLRRVGAQSWHLAEGYGLMMPTFLFGTVGAPAFNSNTQFDAGAHNFFDCTPYWCFFDGATVPAVPTVYSRVCVLPAFDAGVINVAKVFRFRLIADLVVTPQVTLQLSVGVAWTPAGSTWTSPTTSTNIEITGTKRVEYEFEILKPVYMVTPAAAAAAVMNLAFTSNIVPAALTVTTCTIELLGYR